MSSRTYYDILGVSRDATLEEITSAKNALAKVYHPDANMHKDIDTTAFMQEILEAYRVLSNPAKRKAYNLEIFGVTDRVFKTFKLTPEDEKESVSFVTYWNAAVQLQDIIDQSVRVMERASKTKTLSQKLMKKLGKNDPDEMHRERQLSRLSMQAMRQITTLKMAGIPSEYWNIDAMNWYWSVGDKDRIQISEVCSNDMISTWRNIIPLPRRKNCMHINVSFITI